jgi:hypothetical protein
METLHNFFRDLDERMIDLAVENSTEWFKKKLSRAVIQEFYTPILKVSRDRDTGEPDGKWPDTIKIKVPQNQETGAFRTEF